MAEMGLEARFFELRLAEIIEGDPPAVHQIPKKTLAFLHELAVVHFDNDYHSPSIG